MKKLFAILFAVAFIFGCLAMTACGKTEESLDAAYTKYLNQYRYVVYFYIVYHLVPHTLQISQILFSFYIFYL